MTANFAKLPDMLRPRADVECAARSLTEAGPAEPLKGMRRAMAQRMAMAHAQVVPTTVTDEVNIDAWSKGADITIRVVQAIAAAYADRWLRAATLNRLR